LSRAEASIHVDASLAESWEQYFDPRGWGSWVDGYESLLTSEGYPEAGGTLRWRSVPAGRGEVAETVLEHQPRRLHRIRFEDPETEGELTTEFEIERDGTRVRQLLEYSLRVRGPFSAIANSLFVRSQMRRSLERSLLRFKHEAEELAQLSGRDAGGPG
jgi:hypothetical protein